MFFHRVSSSLLSQKGPQQLVNRDRPLSVPPEVGGFREGRPSTRVEILVHSIRGFLQTEVGLLSEVGFHTEEVFQGEEGCQGEEDFQAEEDLQAEEDSSKIGMITLCWWCYVFSPKTFIRCFKCHSIFHCLEKLKLGLGTKYLFSLLNVSFMAKKILTVCLLVD